MRRLNSALEHGAATRMREAESKRTIFDRHDTNKTRSMAEAMKKGARRPNDQPGAGRLTKPEVGEVPRPILTLCWGKAAFRRFAIRSSLPDRGGLLNAALGCYVVITYGNS